MRGQWSLPRGAGSFLFFMSPLFSLRNSWRCVRADRALRAGREGEAVRLWLAVLESAGAASDSAWVVRAAGGLRGVGRARAALDALERICGGGGGAWRVRHEWARLLFEAGFPSRAIGVWNELLARNAPLNEAAILKIAACFCEEGALVRALEILTGAIERLGASPKLEAALSNSEFAAGIRPDTRRAVGASSHSVLFVPVAPEGGWKHVEKVLGFNQILVAGRSESDWKKADAFAVFDEGRRTKGNALCRSLASFAGKPLWRISPNPLARPEAGGFAWFVDLESEGTGIVGDGAKGGLGTGEVSQVELERAGRCLRGLAERGVCLDEWLGNQGPDGPGVGESSLEEKFAVRFLRGARYFLEDSGEVDGERYLARISERAAQKNETVSIPAPTRPARAVRILFVLPSGRSGATGRYIQVLAEEFMGRGAEVCILADGDVPAKKPGKPDWWKMEFNGPRLAPEIRRAVLDFSPDWVYLNGVRTRAQRAALEAVALTGARLALHSEDEDVSLHALNHGWEAADRMAALDKAAPALGEVAEFLRRNDWEHTLSVFRNPAHDRWTEPVLRAACQHLACLHTAIWHPFAERLRRIFPVPVLVVPPVAACADFESQPLDAAERKQALEGIGLAERDFVLYVAGTIYSYSNEFEIFLQACALAAEELERPLSVVVSGRSELPLDEMAGRILRGKVKFVNLRQPPDSVYTRFLKVADLVCSPGVPDEFNKLRLPSRLVRAMAMGRPVLTCRTGFGESLKNGVEAFLTEGSDPEDWKKTILEAENLQKREQVALGGKKFAEANFRPEPLCEKLLAHF